MLLVDTSFNVSLMFLFPYTSLLSDLMPPINPPELIDDADDKKPEDWVRFSVFLNRCGVVIDSIG